MGRLEGTSSMGRIASVASLALACVALVGCEAVPVVRFAVWESPEATPVTFEEDGRPDRADVRTRGAPIPNAIILLPVGRTTVDPAIPLSLFVLVERGEMACSQHGVLMLESVVLEHLLVH